MLTKANLQAEMLVNVGTQAAIRAGYKQKWAGVNADKLLKNTNIKDALIEALK